MTQSDMRKLRDEREDCRPDDEGCNPVLEPTKAKAIKASISQILSGCTQA